MLVKISAKGTSCRTTAKENQPHIYKRMFLYDEEKNAGYILQRDYKKGFHYLGEYLKTAKNILLYYKRDRKKWHKARPQFTSLEFWEKYLKLDK